MAMIRIGGCHRGTRRGLWRSTTTPMNTRAALGLFFSYNFCYSCLSTYAAALQVAVLTGTTRTEGPPRPILGPRVARFVVNQLERRGNTVTVLDPRELNLPLLERPEFAYSQRHVPAQLSELKQILQQADAYVTITPEYNHAPSPALLNILNHFGSSVFSFKPSAIVSYSAGQWGGTRAAMALRPVLSELGCLPVSAMIHIPLVSSVLDEHGQVIVPSKENEETRTARQWESYVDRCFSQMEWWGEAARRHKERADPVETSPAFRTSPSERNAP